MNTKIFANNLILKNKITIESNCKNENIKKKNSLINSFCRERDQFERRIADLDRQIAQEQLHIQTQNKEKENLLQQVKFAV